MGKQERSDRYYECTTMEDARIFHNALQYPSAYDRVSYVIMSRPDFAGKYHRCLAKYLGLARETVTRQMLRLKREGRISTKRGTE